MQINSQSFANNLPFQDKFLQSEKSFLEFIAEYDLINSTSFFIKLNECDALLDILKNIANEFSQSADLTPFVKISEKIDFLKNNYFPFIAEKYSMNNFPNVINFLFSNYKIIYAKYINHLADLFWKAANVYDYNQNFYTRRLKLCKILDTLHASI